MRFWTYFQHVRSMAKTGKAIIEQKDIMSKDIYSGLFNWPIMSLSGLDLHPGSFRCYGERDILYY